MIYSGKSKKYEQIIALFAAFLIASAWIIGLIIEKQKTETNLNEYFSVNTTDLGNDIFLLKTQNDSVLYCTIGKSQGYGGELTVIVSIDKLGFIKEVEIFSHHETPSFLNKLKKRKFQNKFAYQSVFKGYIKPDVISGATLTSTAVTNAVNSGVQNIGKHVFNQEYLHAEKKKIMFELPEITLILLFLTSILILSKKNKYKKHLFWAAVFISIIVIGFIKGGLLTISKIDATITGNFGPWQTNLYWIILFAGIILTTLIYGKNIYCLFICPFGGIQECTGYIGKAKTKSRKKIFVWLQRFLALGTIILGLIYRNPTIASYEVFPAMFAFIGSSFLFILLAINIVVSLFIKRFWCNYLCPVGPAINYFVYLRNLLLRKTAE